MKTMLRRYEALGGAVVLLLSKRVAGLLSMVFCAKVTKLKCRWFFGRVFSFPLVEEFV